MQQWIWRRYPASEDLSRAEVEGVLLAGDREIAVQRWGEAAGADPAWTGGAVVGGVWSEGLGPAWMPAARAEFLRRADAVGAAGKGELLIWPRAGGAVADVPSVLSFVRARPRWKFVLDPVSVMVPSLLERVDDHLRRIFEALGASEQVGAVALTSCEVVGERLVHRPLGTNPSFDRSLMRWWRELGPAERPVILLEGDALPAV